MPQVVHENAVLPAGIQLCHQSIRQHHVNVCHRGSMKMLYYLLACNCAINRYDSVSPVNDTDSSLSLSSMQAMCIGREDYMYNFGTPQLHAYTGALWNKL